MKHLLRVAIIWFFLCGITYAQSLPPVQTINPNVVGCNGISSQGAVTQCQSGWTYGCNSGISSSQIISTDGQRNSILFQDTGTIPIVLCFGDSCMGLNGFVVQPGNSFLWSNLNQGNLPGKVATSSVSVMSNGASTCTFMFTD